VESCDLGDVFVPKRAVYSDEGRGRDHALVALFGDEAVASIFLSHSSQDNEVAGDVSRRLKEHGYDSLFVDFDPDLGIKGGRDWERELYRNLKLAGAVIVLCSPSSMASRWCFVEIAQAKALGKAIFPIKISSCQVENILKDRQVIDLTAVGVEEACRRLFDSLHAAGLDPADSFHWDSKRPPFPGLNYFDTEDAGIYFGRENEVRLVIETLTRMQRQGEPRLLVVVGSSGSGKSSLVRAGVLPRLGKDQSQWAMVEPFRPGVEPIRKLAQSLASAFAEGLARPDWKAIRDRLKDECREARSSGSLTTSALTDYADDLTIHLARSEASLLLVVDQVEELLQSFAGNEASDFFQVLRRATERPGGRVFGLLTLRSDFLGSFQNHPALRGLAFADLPLALLPVENFPQVIEGPADRAEIALEPGLVRSMIADARTDDALPLLAFTLREMYERCRNQQRLTLKVYRDDLGGIKGAVARVVERIKAEGTWTSEVGRALRRAFLKLARVNDEGQFSRQPCRWADLPDLAAPVLEFFVKARLLSSNGDVVEVTHESLFRVWPELAGWLDEGRELMLWRKNLQNEADDWIAHDRSPHYLLSGARVAEGRRWLASNADDFPGPEGEFITTSIAAEDKRIAREHAQQEKLRWLTRCLAVAAVTASVLSF
jgi:TIR domain/AAA ATPase domain